MRKIFSTTFFSLLIALCLNAQALAESETAKNETIAREFVGNLEKEDFSSASKTFDETMSKAMPAEKLKETWAMVINQAGKFKKQTSVREEKIQQFDVVFVKSEFEKAFLDIQVVLNSDKKIAGINFLPAK